MTNPTAPVRTRRGRKALVPLATLLVASALAVGSGATFTSESQSTIALTAGTLEQANNNSVILDLHNIEPGFSETRSVTITNTGSLPATFTIAETASTNAFDSGVLRYTVTEAGNEIHQGEFGSWTDGEKKDAHVLQPGASRTYTFTVSFDAMAGNTNQGKQASATFTFDAVQL